MVKYNDMKDLLYRIVNNKIFIESLWFFLKYFYPKGRGRNPFLILAVYFFSQKILRINGKIPWPVFSTSRVLHWKNIEVGFASAPGESSGNYINGRNGIIIGKGLTIGPNVGIISANHDPEDYTRHLSSEPIYIGDYVWIGMNSVILPGVKIGSNVIIGANSVVTKDIPANSIAAGNPCEVIKAKSPYIGKNEEKIEA
jgi:acetyltransferase-like isoleucine patch superfamily enzyme